MKSTPLQQQGAALRSPPTGAIPFADLSAMTQEVREEVDASFAQVLDTGRFIGGAAVARFEDQWAAYCGTTHAVAVANGTDAIQLVLRAMGIGPGDEVVVPTNTFVATAEAVVLAGAVPRFADVSPDTLLLTPATLEAALTPRTRAVIVVHLYGQMADMQAISGVAAAAGLALVEDAAQAHGGSWEGRPAGSWGRAGCFSFYPGKNLGAFGDAGAVVTDDADLADHIRSMRNHGRSDGSHHDHPVLGTNSRMDALQAVVLSAKLPRLDAWIAARRAAAARYEALLAGGPVRLVGRACGAGHAYHLLVARVPDRDRVRRDLAGAGVETGLHYPTPCHLMAPYRRYGAEPLPVAEHSAGQILSLPLFPHMTHDQVTAVCARLRELVPAEASSDVA
ncbi:DegT/DnrJ/EryC1/StrS family aminotransferase [Geodermatophilus ruber]|uniref:dTDP-4-amino-4,6-dideoxygalactose transaminase n=1 Tax=Geodermatophilus ruber TaxID=504800 RepID=A0A1I4LBH2_9ACTN|nr:DegT/DnrJ/EryC1/StrS family aminotransferase [Geodermatophilus ruber]SFL88271.1 dTDP-4-amino-4,6-dideoxygalactose transaminase [Geodermatophilus ruber]